MLYLIHFVFVALIILIIWLYFHSTKKSKRYAFKRIASLLSMILVISTAWFTVILNMEMREESSRKPELRLVVNKVTHQSDEIIINSIMLINDGNIEATVLDVYIVFPESSNIKINSFDVLPYYKTKKGKVFYKYDWFSYGGAERVTSNGGSVLLYTNDALVVDDDMKQIEYEIAYTSKYDSGIKSGFFGIKE